MYQIVAQIFDNEVKGKIFDSYANAKSAIIELQRIANINNFPAIYAIVKI